MFLHSFTHENPGMKPADSAVPLSFDFAEGREGVKTDFCPAVSGFCPLLARILSRFVLVFVTLWPDQKGSTWRMRANCSGGKRMKIDVDSGAAVSVVPQMQCTVPPSRARARWGQTYGSERMDQVQSVHVRVAQVQWGSRQVKRLSMWDGVGLRLRIPGNPDRKWRRRPGWSPGLCAH
jgi:hypothetical protein